MRLLPHAAVAAMVSLSAAGSAAAQAIVTDPGLLYSATSLSGFATSGSDMGGLRVTAFFSGGTSSTGAWSDLGGGTWGVNTGQFSLTLGGAADTFNQPWSFASTAGLGLTRLVLNGAPGKTVFDLQEGTEGTPGSALGAPLHIVGGDPFGATALYRNLVQIGGAAPVGDIFETLDVVFDTPVGPNGFQFIADTDNISARGTITATPEPASVVLLATGALAIAGVARRRRMVS